MGGQACVFYGAAQFSRDVDLALLAEDENLACFRAALEELQAVRIAVPGFGPVLLARGHSVHFRCRHPKEQSCFPPPATESSCAVQPACSRMPRVGDTHWMP
jgi:hypothetical protein